MLFLRGSKIEYGSRTVHLAVILCSFVNDIFDLRSQVQKTLWVWGVHKLKPDILNSLKMINFARNLSKQLQLHSAVWPPAGAIKKNTHGGTRTPNLWFRRPTPYPLGHAGFMPVEELQNNVYTNEIEQSKSSFFKKLVLKVWISDVNYCSLKYKLKLFIYTSGDVLVYW